MDIGTIVTLIIAGISVIATVVIVFFTYKTIKAYEKQVDIGQEQQFNQFRPILQPVGSLEDIIDRSARRPNVKWGVSKSSDRGTAEYRRRASL